METRRVTAIAEDGTPVTLVVPTNLPTEDRAEYLRRVFDNKLDGVRVSFPDGDWKGRVTVRCDNRTLVADAREALEFMGALPDGERVDADGGVTVFSRGYYAHGF